MIILGIETSCDETAAAIVTNANNRVEVLSNVVASSAKMQAKYGGVIPEQAAREQLKSIIPVVSEAIQDSGFKIQEIDLVAVTQGPGLVGSLLIGVETAKTLSLAWKKPIKGINHLLAHFYANWIKEPADEKTPIFPMIGLLVSGGHSDIVLFKDHDRYEYLGGTRDDAAGECFDKSARLLGLSGVQGGPMISKLAEAGNRRAFQLPRPLWDSSDFDYSFAGLKTSILNIVEQLSREQPKAVTKNDSGYRISDPQLLADLSASLEEAVVDSLIKKVVLAAQKYNIETIMISGGVAANSRLRQKLTQGHHGKLLAPLPKYCTDNAAMVAVAGLFVSEAIDPLHLQANPNLSLSF